jgi:hypothetical protein
MGSEDSAQPLKRPTIFFIILDFLIALVLSIILLEVDYSETQSVATKQKKGRISICVILIFRVVYSSIAEWARQNFLKPYLIDVRQSFKLYAIIRYVFILLVFSIDLTCAYMLMEFNGTLMFIVIGVLGT